MDTLEAMQLRHAVRQYTDRKIEGAVLDELRRAIDACNGESGLNMQLCLDEPDAFAGRMARYGQFDNVKNYVALAGRDDGGLDEKCGYYGEKIVLKAQQLGLNTCWVALTYSKGKSKSAVSMKPGEKLRIVVAVGYGKTPGMPRKTKSMGELCRCSAMPDWFRRGMEAVQLAPTAMNQQKFRFELNGDEIMASAGTGFYTKVDLGIAKYHFELGAGEGEWKWAARQ